MKRREPAAGSIDCSVPVTGTPGILWPALPTGPAAVLLAMAQQLDDSQWWPTEVFERQQNDQLAELLAYAEQTIPFWRKRLQAAGFRAERVFTPEVWRQIPIMTLAELRAAGDQAFGTAVPAEHGPIGRAIVEGPDGPPLPTAQTPLAALMADAARLREAQWDARRLDGPLAVVGAAGGAGTGWGAPFDGLFPSGPCMDLPGDADADAIIGALEREPPDSLLAPDRVVARLIERCAARALPLPVRRLVVSRGRPLSAPVRKHMQADSAAALFDGYDTPVTGPLAYPCAEHGAHHVHAELVKLEILDSAGKPCPTGQSGRVVVTVLHAFARPIIRCDLGHEGAWGAGCGCGRTLPAVAGVP